jgi:hypothetical protein
MTLQPIVYALLVCALTLAPVASADEPAEKEAVPVATTWLALIDAGDYAASWETAAEMFKKAVTKEQWEQSLKGLRPSLGKVLEREVESAQYATSLPGAPDGEYVVIQFKTSFEHKKSAVETVTPMKDPDGRWRVSGYYIR